MLTCCKSEASPVLRFGQEQLPAAFLCRAALPMISWLFHGSVSQAFLTSKSQPWKDFQRRNGNLVRHEDFCDSFGWHSAMEWRLSGMLDSKRTNCWTDNPNSSTRAFTRFTVMWIEFSTILGWDNIFPYLKRNEKDPVPDLFSTKTHPKAKVKIRNTCGWQWLIPSRSQRDWEKSIKITPNPIKVLCFSKSGNKLRDLLPEPPARIKFDPLPKGSSSETLVCECDDFGDAGMIRRISMSLVLRENVV